MSIYFIRYNDLIKIGYSSGLSKRVYGIISSIPGAATFMGHMPGERDVEAHLHERFSQHRFSGEWFVVTDDILAFARIALDPEMPAPPLEVAKSEGRLLTGEPKRVELAETLRRFASRRWPDHTHAQRKTALAKEMGINARRVKSLYEAESTYLLRIEERDAIDALATALRTDAQQIQPKTTDTDKGAPDA